MKIFTALLILVHGLAVAQNPIMEMKPSEIRPFTLSSERAAKFKNDRALFNKVSKKLSTGMKQEELSGEERRVWNEIDETIGDYWDIIGGGCSWYCGGGTNNVTTSSSLQSQGANSYAVANAHDLSFETAWVEGVAGDGVGEFLQYKFPPESPRITDIIVVNGYVKSERAYLDNSRVKKLKMYINNKPYAMLLLDDQRSQQTFKFHPIGNGNRENIKALKLQPEWILKFEIIEVYKGLKYDDVAITEIYFDGLDVH